MSCFKVVFRKIISKIQKCSSSKFKLIKSLLKISIYDILTNNFKLIKVSEIIQPEYRIPIKILFQELNFNYQIDSSSLELHRNNNWFNHIIFLILVSSILRSLIYIFIDFDDIYISLYFGNLIQFNVENTTIVSVVFCGLACYSTSMFCLFNFCPVNQLKWLNIFNAIEGRQSFLENKILLKKSAKKLIRFSLILLTSMTAILYINILINFVVFSCNIFISLNLKDFLLFVVPWNIINAIWTFYSVGYAGASVFIIIICFYYKLRLHQLNIYVIWLLKRNQLNQFNQRIERLLNEYNKIINEINLFNKFASKILFFMFLFIASMNIFMIYNVIYVKLKPSIIYGHLVVILDLSCLISLIILNAIRITNQAHRNQRKLMPLIFMKQLKITNKIKVIDSYFNLKIQLFSSC